MAATVAFRHRGFQFRLYHDAEQPPAAWLLTFCGHDLVWLPELHEETTVSLTERCEEWLRANFRLMAASGNRFQLYLQYRDFFQVQKDDPRRPINWIVVQEELYQGSLPIRHMPTPADPEPALLLWLAQHPLTCVGGPLAGRRSNDQGESFRPLVAGKAYTRDGPVDASIPAAGLYWHEGTEYVWRADPPPGLV